MGVVAAICALGGCTFDPVTWDRDKDNRFERNEFLAFGPNHWKWDFTSAGSLTPEKFENGWTQTGWKDSARAFREFDENGDGGVTSDEFFTEDQWAKLDANGDGVLDAKEWTY